MTAPDLEAPMIGAALRATCDAMAAKLRSTADEMRALGADKNFGTETFRRVELVCRCLTGMAKQVEAAGAEAAANERPV